MNWYYLSVTIFCFSFLVCEGCSSSGNNTSSPGSASGTARFFNGATPTSASTNISAKKQASIFKAGTATPTEGHWLISPNKMILTLTNVSLNASTTSIDGRSSSSNSGTLSCPVTYDLSNVGLAKLIDCPFTISPGTYSQIFLSFDATYQVLIDDSTNGFYTTSSGIMIGSPPEGGADYFSVTTSSSGSTFGNTSYLASPLTIADGDTVTLSVVLSGLQFFHIDVSSGVVTVGWPNSSYVDDPFRPDMTASVTSPATMGYYVAPEIGTALSYNYTAADVMNTSSVSVYYSSATTPTFLVMGSGTPSSCPIGISGLLNGAPTVDTPKSGGYLGLDMNGVLGWATPTDDTWTAYGTELSMAQATTLNDTTTLNCKTISTDPAPSGGTFASGAPDTSSPEYTTKMVLVAQ